MNLRVQIPDTFRQEREYVLRVLCETFLGLELEIGIAPELDDYVFHCPQKTLRLKDAFFHRRMDGSIGFSQEDLPGSVVDAALLEKENTLILYGKGEISRSGAEIVCHADLLASAFFMLTRWEETLGGARDEHGRFPAASSLAFRYGFLRRPVVDEYTALLRSLFIECGVPDGVFREFTFEKNPGCDADYPFYNKTWTDPLRHIGRAIFKDSGKGVVDELDWGFKWWLKGRDPYDHIGRMMELAEAAGEQFTFYLMAGGSHKFDPPDRLEDPAWKKLVARITVRGHTIGFHPGYASAMDPAIFCKEWDRLKTLVPHTEPICRQHYLRFRVPDTWNIQEDCGMVEDSSLGYAEVVGFRCGTSRSFPVFDVLKRKQLHLKEKPLLIMDVSLKSPGKGPGPETLEAVEEIIAQVKKHKGELNFLWHNSSFEMQGWEAYESVFLRLLNC